MPGIRAFLLSLTVILLAVANSLFAENILSGSQSGFMENKGQIHDQYGNLRSDVKYVYCQGNFKLILRENGFSYELSDIRESRELSEAGISLSSDGKLLPGQVSITTSRVDVSFPGANKQPCMVAVGRNSAPSIFYTNGKKEGISACSYKEVTYHNIYRGIDLVFHSDGKLLKYDIVVRPGGNLHSLKMVYEGMKKLSVENTGLVMHSFEGQLTESIPLSYQQSDGRKIQVTYLLNGNAVKFQAVYDKHQTLVIDPVIGWASYYGGSSTDHFEGGTADSAGNLYLVGTTNSYSAIASSGAHQTKYGGGYFDAIIVKMDANGARKWATYYGGSGEEGAYSAGVDKSGNVYVCGSSLSTDNISTSGSYQAANAGYYDGFLLKLDGSGKRIWATYVGGDDFDYLSSMVLDNKGNIYTEGTSSSTNGIATTGAFQSSLNGSSDFFLSKFDTSGKLKWSTYYGGESAEAYATITLDNEGRLYLGGYTSSTTGISTSKAFQKNYGGNYDGCIGRFDTTGKLIWATYYGGPDADKILSVVTDKDGSIYATGYSRSTVLIATVGSYQLSNAGLDDAFLVKFDSTGSRLWGTFYGGKQNDWGNAVSTDENGFVYMTASIFSDSIATADAYQKQNAGNLDAFLVKFDSDGNPLWATYYGGTGNDYGIQTLLSNKDMYLLGYTTSDNGISFTGGYQKTIGGDVDGYVMKFAYRNVLVTRVLPANVCFDGKKVHPAIVIKNNGHVNVSNIGLWLRFKLVPNIYMHDSLLATLKPGQSDTIFFKDSLTVKGDTLYKFDAYINYRDDQEADDTFREAIRVYAPPTAAFTYKIKGRQVNFQAKDIYLDSYQWDLGDGTTSKSDNPQKTYDKDGTYIVRLTVRTKIGCTSTFTDTIKVNNSGIADQPFGSGWNIYPNPVHDHIFRIENGSLQGNIWIRLYDISGKMVWESKEIARPGIELHLPENIVNGVYQLRISGEHDNWSQKLMIE